MGFTIVAILTGALLLPGIIFICTFYIAGWTDEVAVEPPPLSSIMTVGIVGVATLATHFAWAVVLYVNDCIEPLFSVPMANPYLFMSDHLEGMSSSDGIFGLFSGLLWVSAVGGILGFAAGKGYLKRKDQSLFYGPLQKVVTQAEGPNAFVSAYVLVKIQHDDKILGYEGVVHRFSQDSDRNPSSVTLKDVSVFQLVLGERGPRRVEGRSSMDWITISSAEWSNIAVKVWRVVED